MIVESLVDVARRHIQLWIIKGEYHPGQKLKEEEISARLNISRMPIREAFKALEIEGLVIRKPRRGVFVTLMTEKDVWEVYTLKAYLYEMATELAIDLITDTEIERLEKNVTTMEDCIRKDPVDLLKYQDQHWRFHERIMTISTNTRLKKFSASLHYQVSRFSYLSLQGKTHLNSSAEYHRWILDAIKNREKSKACRLMKKHVLMALDVVQKKIEFDDPEPSPPGK
jgi:DNA-binding GntR family transcriptional regulator